ncbi:hypothetical protein [Desulfobulbus propionicus]|uniref:hypothetical protein n=1 Tax=Desulfobulbus propionicus TaxID=894 RepID=UPI00146F7452|nr:hypothetical protein [Desulfobulbus propionicus]
MAVHPKKSATQCGYLRDDQQSGRLRHHLATKWFTFVIKSPFLKLKELPNRSPAPHAVSINAPMIDKPSITAKNHKNFLTHYLSCAIENSFIKSKVQANPSRQSTQVCGRFYSGEGSPSFFPHLLASTIIVLSMELQNLL